MVEEFRYEIIKGTRTKAKRGILEEVFPFLYGLNSDHLKPKESNRIITNFVRKIKQYEETRKIETKYSKVMTNQGERIKKVEMESKDKIVWGIIKYVPGCPISCCGCVAPYYTIPSIEAEFNFNSNNPADKQEYLGLVKIIQRM